MEDDQKDEKKDEGAPELSPLEESAPPPPPVPYEHPDNEQEHDVEL